MTQETQDQEKAGIASNISIGIVEKAWEFKWGIQLVYIALYADALLGYTLHMNLLSVTLDSSQIWTSVGALLLGVAGFCLTVSLIIPTISGFLCTVIREYAPNFIINALSEHSLRQHDVSLHYLHEQALEMKDEFLMAIYQDEHLSSVRRHTEHQQIGTLVCGLVLLTMADIWAGSASGTETLLLMLAKDQELPFYICLSLAMAVLLIWASLRPYPREGIYHPTLRKQQDQEQDARYGRGDDK